MSEINKERFLDYARNDKMEKVVIRVPASSSNLGPGFDCLGVALRVYNEIVVSRRPAGRLPQIVAEAADLFFKHTRLRPFRFSCSTNENVPRMRGLGSSATIRLGILEGLNVITRAGLDRFAVFRLCGELEGHPDNAAPSAFGGFTVTRNGSIQRFEVSPRLQFVLLVPDFEIKTPAARKILPANIARLGAVESCGNACAITAAFASQNYEELRGAFADRLHQPFRTKLIPMLPRVITAAEKAGALGAFLSGSGSSICAIASRNPKRVGDAMRRSAKNNATRIIIASADNHGLQIEHRTSNIKHLNGSPS
jgi:homoserine kinase